MLDASPVLLATVEPPHEGQLVNLTFVFHLEEEEHLCSFEGSMHMSCTRSAHAMHTCAFSYTPYGVGIRCFTMVPHAQQYLLALCMH